MVARVCTSAIDRLNTILDVSTGPEVALRLGWRTAIEARYSYG
jgi:hypothetical protein